MEYMTTFINFILHLNIHLNNVIDHMGGWSYVILFIVIFVETGVVIFPLLPGDSLLFTAGYLSSVNELNIAYLLVSLIIAAAVGNSINYLIGRWLGPKVFHFPQSRWFKPIYLHKAHFFYEKYGGRAVMLARFIPIIRTFVPFVAGIAKMGWSRFQWPNISSSIIWVAVILYLGYSFGNVPIIAAHFSAIVIAIGVISILPIVIKIFKNQRNNT